MEMMHTVMVVLMVLCSAVMTFFILMQDGKGGGLVVDTACQIEGTTSPVRRATGIVAGVWLSSAIILAVMNAL